MARRNRGLLDVLASVPWPIGFILGIVAYAGVRYGISAYLAASSNPFLSALGKAADQGTTQLFAWLILAICWVGAICSFFVRRHRSQLLETQTGLESLRAMNWRQFEMLVGEAFRRQGYKIEETGLGGADGGVDLRLSKNGKTTLVQCKQWRNKRVDVKVVREMYGLLAHHHTDAIKIVAIGDFTPDAQRFVQGKPMELVHGEVLLAMIQDVQSTGFSKTASVSPRVSAVDNPNPKPASASAASPDCPNCGAPMIRRTNRRSGNSFWGCPKYPSCRGTRPA